MTIDYSDVSEALKDVLDRPDAERPYLRLAKAYRSRGMKDEAEAIMFLVDRRFGGMIADGSNPDEEQRVHGIKDP